MSFHWVVTVRNEEFHLNLTASYKLHNIRLYQHTVGHLLKADLFLIVESALNKEQNYLLLWDGGFGISMRLLCDFKVNEFELHLRTGAFWASWCWCSWAGLLHNAWCMWHFLLFTFVGCSVPWMQFEFLLWRT